MGVACRRRNEGSMANILVCDDDREIVDAIEIYLSQDGYKIYKAYDGEQAIQILDKEDIHLLIMDIMMPRLDGIRATLKIREYSSIPIIILSAKSEDTDKILGLNIGADDYICKPYDIDILIAKINGIFKRKYALDEIVCDNLKLNNVTQTLTVNQTPVNVTEKEFQLLKLLVENKGTTLKKEYLFNRIWGSDSESEPQTLTVHIKWLREKIEQDSKKPKHIITVWGTGYRYE